MGMVQNIFQPMLTMLRVAMITTREPQEEMILSRLSARKIHWGLRTLHSSAIRLCNKTEPSLDTLSQKGFLRDLQRKTTLEYSVTEVYLLIIF